MPGFDDLLTRELERAARPADPAGTFEGIDRRRAHRAGTRKLGSAALAVVVIAGTLGGVAVLRNVFRETTPPPGGAGSVENGAIVLSRVVPGEGTSLWVVSPEGERRLTDESEVSDVDAAVSPDGRTVAFVRIDASERSTIWLVEIDGGEPRRLTSPEWSATGPAWSPDGLEIVFAGDAGDGYGLYVTADEEGAAPRRITGPDLGRPSDPTWSPHGSTIVFAVWSTVPGATDPNNYDLFAVSADGSGEATRLTDTPDVAESEPAFSPDGERIAFARVSNASGAAPSGGIALMAADGSDVRELVSGGSEHGPAWAPDGSVMAFAAPYPSGLSVFTIRLDGSGLTRVAAGGEPAWQPLLDNDSANPSPSPTPTPSPSSAPDGITGFAFPVCNPRGIAGDFDGNGTTDAAYVVTKMSDVGGCPQADQAENLLAVDLDGDRVVDAEGGPISCELDCIPFVATDLNVDGDDELFVAQLLSPIVGLVPYALVDGGGGPAMVPITFAPPGDPGNDLRPDDPPMLYVGGDEGFAARLGCNPTEAGAVLTAVTGDLDSIEQPTAWTIRRTEFRMDGDRFVVLDTSRSQEPAGDQGPFGSEVDPQLCGQPFAENGVFPTSS